MTVSTYEPHRAAPAVETTASSRIVDEGLAMISLDRITSDPARMNGQPCVRNLRLTVRRVIEAIATYPDRAELLREYPDLDAEDIRQVLLYAAAAVDDKVLELPKTA